MARSLKKNPFVANHLLKKIERLNTKAEKEIIITWSRASTIIPTMIDRFLGFVVNLIGSFQLRKSIVQTALKGRAFPIFIGTSVPETMVSPIIAPLGCKIYLFSPSP